MSFALTPGCAPLRRHPHAAVHCRRVGLTYRPGRCGDRAGVHSAEGSYRLGRESIRRLAKLIEPLREAAPGSVGDPTLDRSWSREPVRKGRVVNKGEH